MTFREGVNFWGTIIFGTMMTIGVGSEVYKKFWADPSPKSTAAPTQKKVDSSQDGAKPPASNKASTVAVASHREDGIALKILKHPQLWGSVCERLSDTKVVDRVRGTASANNHPAFVVGYQFVCVDSVAGNQSMTHYVGWMENRDTGQTECIHHNRDKNRVVGDGWWQCGGNFKTQ
jgi:hypothetical protein